MADREFGIETLCLHAGQLPDPATGARAVPLYQTTSYVFDSADHAASLFNLQTFGNIYTRLSNPTTAVFEERMAALEGGTGARRLATASGMAAEMTAMLTLLQRATTSFRGEHALRRHALAMFDVNFRKLGIDDDTLSIPTTRKTFRRARSRTKTKRGLRRDHRQPVDQRARPHRTDRGRWPISPTTCPLVIDNTFPTPHLCRPMEWGADIVVHSATKFIGGHGTSHRRRAGGIGPVSLGQRQVPGA